MSRTRLWTSKVPYSVTLILAILAWSTAHFIDRNTNSPLLEYSPDLGPCGSGSRCFRVKIRNLSASTRFADVEFGFLRSASENAEFYDPAITVFPPFWDGDEFSSGMAVGDPPNDVRFSLREIQPGAVIELQAGYTGELDPTFHLLSSTIPMRITSIGLSTVVTRFQGLIFLSLWMGALPLLWAYYFPPNRRKIIFRKRI